MPENRHRFVHALAIVAALVLPALAGCLTPGAELTPADGGAGARGPGTEDVGTILTQLSPRLGDLDILHEVLDVETPHGVINVDLYKPDVPEGTKLPVILVASPYNNANSPLALSGGGKRGDENWISLPLYEWIRAELMPRGYAFAQMDILGTRNSGGCMGIMNEEERQASAAVVDWLGAQEWTNGKVGMIGKSYLGLSQIGAAVENPERLATIVPISAPTHDYAYHYYNGVPYELNHLTNVLYYGAFSLPPFDGDAAEYGARYPERVPCAPEAIAGGAYTMGDYSARWQERDYRPLVPQMRDDLSVFFIHGHKDWNVKPDHVLDIYNAIPGPKMALLGQWAHDYPNINNYDEDTYGEREDWYFQLHRWFDHWLLDIDTGVMQEAAACPVQSQGHDGVWRCLNAFPPRPERFDDEADSVDGVQFRDLFPQAAGTIADVAGAGTVQYQDAARTGMGVATGAGVPGTARFLWAPDAPLRIAGTPELVMRVETTSMVNTFLAAALAIEDETGAREEVTWGFLSLRHRDNLETPEPVTPGTAYDVRFRFYPVDHVLQPGEKLVLVLRGDSEAPNGGILKNPTPGVQTVHLEGTRLVLPTVPIDREFTPLAHADLPASYHQED